MQTAINTTQYDIASGGSPSQLTSKQTAQASKTQFLQLLVAQLKGQNPLDPKDGAEFVAQLAQFSSLEELINIRTNLDALVKASTATNTTSNPFNEN